MSFSFPSRPVRRAPRCAAVLDPCHFMVDETAVSA
jgi:hypothetical protein